MADKPEDSTLHQRVHEELVDSLDEELEMELDDDRLAALLSEGIPMGRRWTAASTSASSSGCRASS
jgi:hypothetical protein